ncbi:MAG: Uma2 family endonuclease [Saprospiraceae bacterium]
MRLPLPENKQKSGKVDTVVQPDIVVVCDPSKLDEQGCNGAPDFIIEILSPGNSRREMKTKFELYETAGVKEYWLVEPLRECVTCYHLDATGQYVGSRPYFAEDDIPSRVLDGFVLKGRDILNELADLD